VIGSQPLRNWGWVALLAPSLWGQPESPPLWDFRGEWRQQSVYRSNLDLGLEEDESLQQLLSRLRLELGYHPEPGLDFVLGLSSSLAWGSLAPAPIDRDPLYLEQGYVNLPLADSGQLKMGRQLISLGSGRLVAKRLGPNVPLSFDGLHLLWKEEGLDVQLLAMSPVRNQDQALGDRSGQDFLWGAYATWGLTPQTSLDTYWLSSRRGGLKLAGQRGRETRHSLGGRWFGTAGSWDYNYEAVYQWGRFEERALSAWTLATDTGWTLDQEGWKPRLGLKFDVASGTTGGKTLGTFHPLYPNFSYFSEAALISPSNLVDLHPSLTLVPEPGQKLILGWDFLWRYSLQDGLYVPPGFEIVGAGAGRSRYIGDQISLQYLHRLSEGAEFELGFTHFRPGAFVREAGGSGTTFVVTSWKLDF